MGKFDQLTIENGKLVAKKFSGETFVIEDTRAKQKKFFQKVTPLNPFAAQSPFK